MADHPVQEFEVLERCLIVELDEGQVAHERWPIQVVDDDFDLISS